MNTLTIADFKTLASCMQQDSIQELLSGNVETAMLLAAYANDVTEILEREGAVIE